MFQAPMGLCERERGIEREKRKRMGERKKEREWEILKDTEVI